MKKWIKWLARRNICTECATVMLWRNRADTLKKQNETLNARIDQLEFVRGQLMKERLQVGAKIKELEQEVQSAKRALEEALHERTSI